MAGWGGDGGGAGREDDGVHEVGNAVRAGPRPREQRLVDRHGREDHDEGVEVGVGADLTPPSGVLEDGSGRLELGSDEALVDAAGHLGLAVDDGEQGAPRLHDDLVVEAPDGARLGDEVAAERAGVGVLVGGAADEEGERVDDEIALVRPPAIEGGLRGACRGGDGVEGQSVVADVAQHVDRCLEELLLAVTGDPRAAGRGARDGHIVHSPPRSALT